MSADLGRAHSRLDLAAYEWRRTEEAFEAAKVEYFAAIKAVEALTPHNDGLVSPSDPVSLREQSYVDGELNDGDADA